MKQIGEEIGVNESRVSQLHARAIDRLKQVLDGRPAARASAPRAEADASEVRPHRGREEDRQGRDTAARRIGRAKVRSMKFEV